MQLSHSMMQASQSDRAEVQWCKQKFSSCYVRNATQIDPHSNPRNITNTANSKQSATHRSCALWYLFKAL